jgi:hypothetical protein
MEGKKISEINSLYRAMTLTCGSLNAIYSVVAVYVMYLRIAFLLAHKTYITSFDYLYLIPISIYLLINTVGSIMVMIWAIINPQDKVMAWRYVFIIIFPIGGVLILGLIGLATGILIFIPKTEFVDNLTFMLYCVLLGLGLGAFLFVGTFLPILLHYSEDKAEQPQYEMVKIIGNN